MKIAINTCHGCFGLSDLAKERYLELAGSEPKSWTDIDRNDKALVKVVEELGDLANGPYAKLEIIDVETGIWYRINEYDGNEEVWYRFYDKDWKLATD